MSKYLKEGAEIKWFKSTDKGATFTELPTQLGILGKILGAKH